MNKNLLTTLLILVLALSMSAQRTVQGVPYNNPNARSATMASDPSAPEGEDGSFTFDMIQNWTGEGSNRAALVIQWNDSRETHAMVFGYRWDGTAKAADMIGAIAKNDPRFYWLTQSGTAYGSTVAGIGWDNDEDGAVKLYHGTSVVEPDVPGEFYATTTDYDDWTAYDADDFWQSGWYQGYWSYWTKSSASESFIYSSVGISGRTLTDGCWDGWNYAVNMTAADWKTFKAAPSQVPAGAHTEFFSDGLYYTLVSYAQRTVAVSSPFEIAGQPLVEYEGEINIPSTITCNDTTYTVVAVADAAFTGAAVTKVQLPTSVSKIGKEAFMGSTLSSINITDAITSMGDYAFYGCVDLVSPAFPSAITEIAPYVYGSTGISTLALPSHITKVGEGAFSDCAALTSLAIPSTVKAIGDLAFSGCDALTSVVCSSITPIDIAETTFSETAYANATLSVPVGYETAYAAATGWKNFANTSAIEIPVALGDRFYIGNVSYRIDKLADEGNEVVVTWFPFDGEVNSTNLTAANKAGYVGDVIIPAEVTYQNHMFKVVAITDSAFFGADALTSVSIADGVAVGANYTFYNCKTLACVTLPSTFSLIGDYMFYYCQKLAELNMPAAQIASVGNRAFYYCQQLPWPAFSDSLTSVGSYAFYSCAAFTQIAIPDSVTELKDYAFANCSNVTSLTLGANTKTLGSSVFASMKALTSVTFADGTEALPGHVLQNCSALQSVSIPASVTSIGSYAFSGCTVLNGVTLPENLETVGTYAFQNCKALNKVVLPEKVTAIPNAMFNGCAALDSIDIKGAVTSIGNQAFAGCAFKRFELPSTLNTLGQKVFQNCAELDSVAIPASVTSMGTYVFSGCKALTYVELGTGISKLPQYTFQNCTALSDLVIPDNYTAVDNYAVSGCSNSLRVWICSTVPPTLSSANAFRAASSSTYAQLMVPYGTSDTYKAKTYYTNYTIGETVPALSAIAEAEPKVSDNSADLAALPAVAYADDAVDVPAVFAVADRKAFLSAKASEITASLSYRRYGKGAEFVTVPATVLADSIEASIDGLTAGTRYEYQWTATLADVSVNSESLEFTTTGLYPVDYTKGVFFLNEDWFGHDNGTVNFYSSVDDEMFYRVYRRENEGAMLGTTTQFGTIYGGKLFLMSKQAGSGNDAGGRIVVADAKTLKKIASIDNIGGADARGFIGVNDSIGYVGTTAGVYIYDIKNNQVGELIAGTGTVGGNAYSNQIGDMARVHEYIFVAKQGEGVLVIDSRTNAVVATVALADISSVFATNNGNVYAAYNAYSGWGSTDGSAAGFVKIDPYSFETTTIAMPDGMSVLNSWGAWHPGSVAVDSHNDDVVYFANKEYSRGIHRYNFATGEFTENYVELPVAAGGNEVTYGAVSINPADGRLVVTATEDGWGSHFANNWAHFIDTATGDILQTIAFDSYYWFPSMEIYPDVEAPVINLDDINFVLPEKTIRYKLTDIVTDADNLNSAIVTEITEGSDEEVAKARIANGYLEVERVFSGSTQITLVANSNGTTVSKNINIVVPVPDPAPIINLSADVVDAGDIVLGDERQVSLHISGANLLSDITVSAPQSGVVSCSATYVDMATALDGGADITFTINGDDMSIEDDFVVLTSDFYVNPADGSRQLVVPVKWNMLPFVETDKQSIDFGNVAIGGKASATLHLVAKGITNDIYVGGLADGTVSADRTVITAEEAAEGVDIIFTVRPYDVTPTQYCAVISCDDFSRIEIPMNWNVVAAVDIVPTTVDFGGVVIGNTYQRDITVRATAITHDILLSQPTTSEVALSTSVITPDEAANGATVTVTLIPSVLDAENAEFILSCDDFDQPITVNVLWKAFSGIDAVEFASPTDVVVCDIQGRVLVNRTVMSLREVIDILEPGIYVLRADGNAYKLKK